MHAVWCYLSDQTIKCQAKPTQLTVHAWCRLFQGRLYFVQFELEVQCGTIQGWEGFKDIIMVCMHAMHISRQVSINCWLYCNVDIKSGTVLCHKYQ